MRPLAVDVGEAASMLGISESMLWTLLRSGAIARVKIGRRTVIRIVELDRYLEERQRDETPTPQVGVPSESASAPRMEITRESA